MNWNKISSIAFIALACAVFAITSETFNRHLGRAFFLRSPSANSELARSGKLNVQVAPKSPHESSLHKDAEPMRVWGATEDGLPHITHDLKGAQ